MKVTFKAVYRSNTPRLAFHEVASEVWVGYFAETSTANPAQARGKSPIMKPARGW
jgi:hypothetical protein